MAENVFFTICDLKNSKIKVNLKFLPLNGTFKILNMCKLQSQNFILSFLKKIIFCISNYVFVK